MATVSPIDIQKALKGVNYPAQKQDIVEAAKEHGASEEIRGVLEKLPDKSFETPADVNEAIGDIKLA